MVDVTDVKTRLRINHSQLDEILAQDIEAAKAELVRVGVAETTAMSEDNPLIDKAIISYCLWQNSSSDKMADKYEAQWTLWRDEIRKSPNV